MRRSSRRPLENAVRMPPVRYVERLPRPAHPSKLFNPIERPSTISGRTVTRAAVSLRVSSPLITIGALSTGPSGRRLSSIRGVWTKVAMEQIEALLRERSLRRGLRSGPVIRSCERSERLAKDGGEGGIRTHVPLTGQDAFEAPPLRPLRYLSGRVRRDAYLQASHSVGPDGPTNESL